MHDFNSSLKRASITNKFNNAFNPQKNMKHNIIKNKRRISILIIRKVHIQPIAFLPEQKKEMNRDQNKYGELLAKKPGQQAKPKQKSAPHESKSPKNKQEIHEN